MLELVKMPNDNLLIPTKDVEVAPTFEVLETMYEIMQKNGGIGLAANQAGLDQRSFIAIFDRELTVCINPRIISHGKDLIESPEGCLSVLGEDGKPIFRPRSRYMIIDVEYYTISGFEDQRITKRTMKRMNAKIFQHECDHLDGRLCHE